MGNSFLILGATNHSSEERQKDDYYATDPKAAKLLLEVETFNKDVWECACGEKHLAKVLEEYGYNVRCSDIVNRCGNETLDFLSVKEKWNGDIITNPPYKYAEQFITKAMGIMQDGSKLALFLKLQFLEGQKRKQMFEEYPPKVVYVSSSRINCAKNGDFERYTSSAIAYAWYVWQKGYKGETVIKWIN